jgi:transposase InsO family protein
LKVNQLIPYAFKKGLAGKCSIIGADDTKPMDGKDCKKNRKGCPCRPELEASLEDIIIKLRKRYEWGPNKIAGYLEHRGLTVDHHKVYSVICEEGLNHPLTDHRKIWGTKRFQRENCSSLWQADFKLCNDDYWSISYQDDHSRFIKGSVKIWNPTGENVILLLGKAVKRYGVPRQLLTDQGMQFKPARGRLSDFDKYCSKLGIEQITASVRRPTTCGKIEAFRKAYEVESYLFNAHWSFIRFYQYTRLHEGIDYLTPAEIYLKDKV